MLAVDLVSPTCNLFSLYPGDIKEPTTLPAKSRGISSVSVVTITYLFIAGIGETRGSVLCLNGQEQNNK